VPNGFDVIDVIDVRDLLDLFDVEDLYSEGDDNECRQWLSGTALDLGIPVSPIRFRLAIDYFLLPSVPYRMCQCQCAVPANGCALGLSLHSEVNFLFSFLLSLFPPVPLCLYTFCFNDTSTLPTQRSRHSSITNTFCALRQCEDEAAVNG
jgi:hypothetical protein